MTTATADPKQCLALEFRPLIPRTGFGSRAQGDTFRFASVTLVGKFDPTCWKSPCLDRPTVLSDAHVQSVQTRRSSRSGLWLDHFSELQEAPEPLATTIIAAARNAGFPKGSPVKVFDVKGNDGSVIVCLTPDGNSWPNSLEGALYAKTVNDAYSCNQARRVGDRWIVQVEGYSA